MSTEKCNVMCIVYGIPHKYYKKIPQNTLVFSALIKKTDMSDRPDFLAGNLKGHRNPPFISLFLSISKPLSADLHHSGQHPSPAALHFIVAVLFLSDN